MNDDRQAAIIKISAVAVAAPRWVAALLASEGFSLPPSWMGWWIVFSAICALGMSIVEAWAFSYCFRAWRGMTGRSANVMMVMIGMSAVSFVAVMSPYIASSVSKTTMASILSNGWALAAWSVCVAASTILIVASVGYAQKRPSQARTTAKDANASANTSEPVATETRTVTKEEFVTLWSANGHKSIAELAKSMGVNPRTAQKWIAKGEPVDEK